MRLLIVNLILGFLVTGCEIWNAEDKPGSWKLATEFPGQGRERAISFVIDDLAYVGLGFTRIGDVRYDNSDSILLNDFWQYDPNTDTWTQLADFPGKTSRDVSGFAISDKGFIIIQNVYSNSMWEYNPELDEWKQLDDFPGLSRSWAISFTILDKAYYGLGRCWDPEIRDRVGAGDLWEYDPLSKTWIRKADFPGPTREYANVFTIDNAAYICTGRLDSSSLLTTTRDVWEYNSEYDTWTRKADFAGYERHRGISFTMFTKGYLGTGRVVRIPGQSGPYATDYWEYDNVNDQWRRVENYPTGLVDGISFVINEKCFVGLGDIDRINYTKKLYQFDIMN